MANAALAFSIISTAGAAASAIFAYKATVKADQSNNISIDANATAEKANEIANEQKKSSQAEVELQIFQNISQAKTHVSELSLKAAEATDVEIFSEVYKTALETCLNAYEVACSLYNDGKVDPDRFKKSYCFEIQNLFKSPNYKDKLDSVSSTYTGLRKVYEEWFNLEK